MNFFVLHFDFFCDITFVIYVYMLYDEKIFFFSFLPILKVVNFTQMCLEFSY